MSVAAALSCWGSHLLRLSVAEAVRLSVAEAFSCWGFQLLKHSVAEALSYWVSRLLRFSISDFSNWLLISSDVRYFLPSTVLLIRTTRTTALYQKMEMRAEMRTNFLKKSSSWKTIRIEQVVASLFVSHAPAFYCNVRPYLGGLCHESKRLRITEKWKYLWHMKW